MGKKVLNLSVESDSHKFENQEMPEGIDRRTAMQMAGKLAFYTAPAMVALLVAKKAHAGS